VNKTNLSFKDTITFPSADDEREIVFDVDEDDITTFEATRIGFALEIISLINADFSSLTCLENSSSTFASF
jgi:hypothetical protein